LILCGYKVDAQISPPGLGDANTAGWFAVGVRQELDTIKAVQSMSYIGLGVKSNPDNSNPFYKPAIIVLNQEFYHQFHKHWQYSGALSYRRQQEYSKTSPYESEDPSIKQEFRIYGRLVYVLKTSKIKLAFTYRQEFRKFYTPDFNNWPETFQLRSRFRAQFTLNLNANKTQRFICSAEALFSKSKAATGDWSVLSYQESRFCLYYSVSPRNFPLIFNLGYMNDLLGHTAAHPVSYIAFDIIWENPFKLTQRKKEKITENVE